MYSRHSLLISLADLECELRLFRGDGIGQKPLSFAASDAPAGRLGMQRKQLCNKADVWLSCSLRLHHSECVFTVPPLWAAGFVAVLRIIPDCCRPSSCPDHRLRPDQE